MKQIIGFIKNIAYIPFLFMPIKKNTVFFCSFQGMYNDNPKYISQKLHAVNDSLKIYWASSDKRRDDFPDYVKAVPYGSLPYIILSMRANITVDNNFGFRLTSKCHKNNVFHRIYFTMKCKVRKGQLNVSTWHGTPLKHLGVDIPGHSEEIYLSSSDMLLAGCRYTKEALQSGYPCNAKFRLYGTPRNDILVNTDVDIDNLKDKLHIPKDKKIVLYAPTFRDDVVLSGALQMQSLDFKAVFDALNKKFDGEWCFIFRVHHVVLKAFDIKELIEENNGRLINGNIGDDMAEYLVCTDVLITDYSGSMFDFALTKKPCFLFAPDKEQYEEVERGFYMDYDALPFPKSYTADELVEQIAVFDEADYVPKVERFLEDIGNVEDGHASERVVGDILHFLETREKR